jgi:hypothetical protein
MRKIIFIIFCFFTWSSRAQDSTLSIFSDTAWVYVYGGASHDYAKQIIPTSDSGYLVIGTTSSFGVANSDVYVIKTDKNCNRQWSRIYGSPSIEWGYAGRETFDGGFIICGFTNQNIFSGYDAYLTKIDASGNLEWNKLLGDADWDFGYGIELSGDSGFMVIGKTYSPSNGGSDVMIIKTDSLGNQIWKKNFGGPEDESANTIYKTPQGDYLVLGETSSFGSGDKDFYILRFDDNGDTLWTRAYGTPAFDAGYSIDTTASGNYFLFGTSEGNPLRPGKEFYLMELNDSGDTLYTLYDGGPGDEEGRYVLQLPNGDRLFGGMTNSNGLGGKALYMIGFHSNGSFIGGAYFGGTDDEEGYSVALGKDGQIVFAGTTTSDSFGSEDVYLVRIDSILSYYPLSMHYYNDSLVSVEYFASAESIQFAVYPNPFHESATVNIGNFTAMNSRQCKINITDITGRTIKTISPARFPFLLENKGLLRPGVYLMSLYIDDELTSSAKLIVF